MEQLKKLGGEASQRPRHHTHASSLGWFRCERSGFVVLLLLWWRRWQGFKLEDTACWLGVELTLADSLSRATSNGQEDTAELIFNGVTEHRCRNRHRFRHVTDAGHVRCQRLQIYHAHALCFAGEWGPTTRLGGRTDQGLLQPRAVVLSTAGRGPSCVGFIIAFCCAESLRRTGRG